MRIKISWLAAFLSLVAAVVAKEGKNRASENHHGSSSSDTWTMSNTGSDVRSNKYDRQEIFIDDIDEEGGSGYHRPVSAGGHGAGGGLEGSGDGAAGDDEDLAPGGSGHGLVEVEVDQRRKKTRPDETRTVSSTTSAPRPHHDLDTDTYQDTYFVDRSDDEDDFVEHGSGMSNNMNEPARAPPHAGPEGGEGGEGGEEDGPPGRSSYNSRSSWDKFFTQPGILAAVIGGALVGLLCATLLVVFIVYRMRKKDEGSYELDDPKYAPMTYAYSRPPKEFYA